jgi:hypothetical protein
MGEEWKQPKWMAPYVPTLVNTGGWITPEYAMNCDAKDCNLVVNGPRALLCIAVRSQIQLLLKLYEDGRLTDAR